VSLPFHLLIATDGSAPANAALATALRFPWPADTAASAVIANQVAANTPPPLLSAALEEAVNRIASATAQRLGQRWKDADVRVVTGSPADVIVNEARRLSADVVVLGWRGHGKVRRYLMGSVSRRVARQAPCSVLVVHRAPSDMRRVVLAFDGSPHARRAVEMIARFSVPRSARITLLSTVDLMFVSPPLVPEERRHDVEREVVQINRMRVAEARHALEEPARRLSDAGWKVARLVRQGEPLTDILATVKSHRADLVVVGAGSESSQSSSPIGGIAQSVLNLSTAPVLVVR